MQPMSCTKEVVLPVERDGAWAAVTEERALEAWLAERVELDLRPGGEASFTRQAVAKHLAVLQDAGLVRAERAGRERRFSPTPAPLGEAISWMASVGGDWDERLAALQRYVARRPRRPS